MPTLRSKSDGQASVGCFSLNPLKVRADPALAAIFFRQQSARLMQVAAVKILRSFDMARLAVTSLAGDRARFVLSNGSQPLI